MLHVPKNMLAIIGRQSSGKTTLARSLKLSCEDISDDTELNNDKIIPVHMYERLTLKLAQKIKSYNKVIFMH